MHYLQNHIWCSKSNWDGEHYDCRHLVGLSSYQEGYTEDWNNLIDEAAEEWFDQEEYEFWCQTEAAKKYGLPDKQSFFKKVNNLKPEVLQWLEENVEDRTGEKINKGWCIGSTEYRANDSKISFTVFFHRRKDAMAFIRRFSKWKKPIDYCQYFTDIRKTLNLETGKYDK